MNEFKNFHPVVLFSYFLFIIAFTCFFLHPVSLAISITGGFVYSVMLKGRHTIKKKLLYMIPALLLMALINPAFNHEGVTILTYLPGGNPLTLESILYGLASAAMIIGVILHFSSFNEVMTSDKFIYLFGKVIPALSLVFSMVLRFVPMFGKQIKNVADSQRCVGRDVSDGGIIKRAKNGLAILSVMVTRSLENAIDTSDSMKSRGYGLPGRTAFSIFTFSGRDRNVLLCIFALSAFIILGGVMGKLRFVCFPAIELAEPSFFGISVFAAYFVLAALPVIIEICEVRRWKSTK